MSSYRRQTKHPTTLEYENAYWIDDFLGSRHYGVFFPSEIGGDWETARFEMPSAYDPREIKLETTYSSDTG